jgi:hypothetical protein
MVRAELRFGKYGVSFRLSDLPPDCLETIEEFIGEHSLGRHNVYVDSLYQVTCLIVQYLQRIPMCIKVGSQYRPEHEYLERQHVSVF